MGDANNDSEEDGDGDLEPNTISRGYPMRVIPKQQIYTVPQVFGLDHYGYKLGKRLAARSEARVIQEITGEQRPSVACAPKGEEVLLQAGTSGNSTILWNTSKAVSLDTGASQVRKRRQKQTDDLLREMVLTHGDPYSVVSWWFRVFEHFADCPPEVNLPKLPVRRDEEDLTTYPEMEVNVTNLGESRPSSATHRLTKMGSRPSSANAAARPLLRPSSVPRLRERPGIPKAKRPLPGSNDEKVEAIRAELRKERSLLKQAGMAGEKAGALDLCRRFRTDALGGEHFQDWASRFELIQDLKKAEFAPGNIPGRRKHFWRSNKRLSLRTANTNRLLTKISEKMDEGGFATSDDQGSSAQSSEGDAASATEETEVDREASLRALCEPSVSEVMLRSASLALLNASIIRKARGSGQEYAKPSYEEVARSRAQILRSVAPVKMTASNFAQVMTCFGIQRKKAVERISGVLLLGNMQRKSKAQQQPQGDDQWQQQQQSEEDELSFEVFYGLMRTLQGTGSGEPTTTASSKVTAAGKEKVHAALLNSELLRRLLFCALTGHTGVSRRLGTAAQLHADRAQKTVDLQSLTSAVRLMLCPQLDESLRSWESAETIPPSAAAGVQLDVQVQGIAEFLLTEFNRAEESSEQPGGVSISFSGFGRFVGNNPGVYLGLVFILMPLVFLGPKYAAEEMELEQKGHWHRAGELQAKVAAQGRHHQRRQLQKLYTTFVRPALARGVSSFDVRG